MIDNKLVSVIITTHNRVNLLPRAIDSVIQQSYSFIECLVVDDASDDGTESYCKQRNDIIYIRIAPKESKGGNRARNIGIRASKGEYVAFLDDDDYWFPTKIEKQLGLMERKHFALCSCGRCIEVIQPDKCFKVTEDNFGRFFPEDMRKQIFNKVCTTTSLIMVRRVDLISIGLFDENLRYWQEYEMCIRLSQIGKFGYTDDILAVYRADSLDSQRLTNRYEGWPETVNYIVNKHKNLLQMISLKDFLRFQQFVSLEAYFRLNHTAEYDRCRYNVRVSMICNALLNIQDFFSNWKCFVFLFFYSYKLLPLWLRRKVSVA